MQSAHGRHAVGASIIALVLSLPTFGQTQQLHQRIDAASPVVMESLVSEPAEDGLLLRRLSLDLRGVVPTRAELDAFVADQSPDRWQRWVHSFTEDPLCDEHLVTFLDRTLMMRRPHAQVDRASWLNYLREQVANNTPLDQLAKQILYSPWWTKDGRAVQKFYLDRGGDPHLITRDLGRVFLGRDLQCAQCHDHPLVDGYKQIDYHGLLAFVSPGSLAEATYKDAEGKEQKMQLYIEKAAGDAAFESVFEKGVPFRSGPRLPQRPEHFESYVLPDSRYAPEAPVGSIAGVNLPPKQSRRQLLSEQLSSRENREFVGNWANRIWAMMFGQGIVHPVDMHHPANPPTNPTLYALITDGLIELDMSPRRFMEQLALTEVYRRGTWLKKPVPADASSPVEKVAEHLASLRAQLQSRLAEMSSNKETALAAEKDAEAGYVAARDAWRTAQADRAKIRSELDVVEAAMVDSHKKTKDAEAALAAATKKQSDNASRVGLLDEAAAKLQQSIQLSGAEDAELKQAIAIATQRAEAARTQIAVLEKATADAKSAFDATSANLTAARQKVEEVVARLEPVHQKLIEADKAMVVARQKFALASQLASGLDRDQHHWTQLAKWFEGQDALVQLQSGIDENIRGLSAIQSQIAAAMQTLSNSQAQLAAAIPARETAREQLAKSNEAKERHMDELKQLQQTLDGLAVSEKLVAAKDPLEGARRSIEMELETRRSQVGQFQAAIDAAQQAFTSSINLVADREKVVQAEEATVAQLNRQVAEKNSAIEALRSELASKRSAVDELWTSVGNEAASQMIIASMTPLSPEQLCWSTLRVSGQLDAYIQNEMNELEKAAPLAADADATTRLARKRQAVRQAFDKLRGYADIYVSLYASGPDKTQDDFFASADQALYVANAGSVFGWSAPGNNNAAQQAAGLTDPQQIATTLYWNLLCRQPTAEEVSLVAQQLAAAGDQKVAVLQEMAWGLIASVEFRFCK